MASRQENLAKLACAYSGVAWGLFWIPLRAMDEAGVTGAWATVMIYIAPLICAAPILVLRWRAIAQGGWLTQMIGLTAGIGLVCYANGVIYTEVVRAMLLFYLTPLWSFILARIFIGEAITPIRWLAMAFGLAGMLIMFGIDTGFPLPRNAGDWMGLAGGVAWAVGALLLRMDGRQHAAFDCLLTYYVWGSVIAIAIALLPVSGSPALPAATDVLAVLPWLVPVLIVVIVPATFAAMWGAPLLNPGTVGLLFMTEISVGTFTAVIWAGEPFGTREIVGIALITAAGLAESVYEMSAKWRKS